MSENVGICGCRGCAGHPREEENHLIFGPKWKWKNILRQNSNLNQSEIHEPERCLVNAERKCRDCGPAVQRSLWGIEIWSGHHLYITPLYFCVLWLLEIYDQCRGPSIKEKDHLSGWVTKVRSQKKNNIIWEFFPTWGGVFPNPKTFVNLPSIFLYAKFILRC